MEVTIAFMLAIPNFPMTVTMPKTTTVYDIAQVVQGIDPSMKPHHLAVQKGGQREACATIVLSPPLVDPPTCQEEARTRTPDY